MKSAAVKSEANKGACVVGLAYVVLYNPFALLSTSTKSTTTKNEPNKAACVVVGPAWFCIFHLQCY